MIHWRWAVRHGTTLRTDTQYTPSDVFETFPQPPDSDDVAWAGKALDEHRSKLMVSRQLGLTDMYNSVHDPACANADIERLRELHVELDLVVRDAYGWSDLPLDHGFHEVRGQGVRFTFSPTAADEVLDRLLELNKARYEAEVAAGLHKRATSGRKKRKASAAEASLFGNDP